MKALKSVEAALNNFWFRPVDARSYAAVRVGFALTSLLQLLLLWPLRRPFFDAGGMIDGTLVYGPWEPYALFHLVRGEPGITLAFLAAAAAMVALAAGWLPRLAIVAVTYWHMSLYHDLSPATSGYDSVLRLTSLFLLVSPLGEDYALTFGKRPAPVAPRLVPAYGLYLIQLQVAIIYFATVWLKIVDQYWRNGQFFSYFMMSQYSLFPSAQFAHLEALSVLMTYGTLITELTLPVFLVFRRTRWLGIVLGVGLHVGIALTSNLTIFSLSMLMLYPAFLTPDDMRQGRAYITSLVGLAKQTLR